MDVLHLIKTDHEEIRSGFKRLTTVNGVKKRREAVEDLIRELDVHLTLERDYLYPEVQGLFAGADDLIASATARNNSLGRKVKALHRLVLKPASDQKSFPKKLDDLESNLQEHFNHSEEILMPKMRGLIRTEDREDLGEVFLDVKEDLARSLVPGTAPRTTTGNRRKKRA